MARKKSKPTLLTQLKSFSKPILALAALVLLLVLLPKLLPSQSNLQSTVITPGVDLVNNPPLLVTQLYPHPSGGHAVTLMQRRDPLTNQSATINDILPTNFRTTAESGIFSSVPSELQPLSGMVLNNIVSIINSGAVNNLTAINMRLFNALGTEIEDEVACPIGIQNLNAGNAGCFDGVSGAQDLAYVTLRFGNMDKPTAEAYGTFSGNGGANLEVVTEHVVGTGIVTGIFPINNHNVSLPSTGGSAQTVTFQLTPFLMGSSYNNTSIFSGAQARVTGGGLTNNITVPLGPGPTFPVDIPGIPVPAPGSQDLTYTVTLENPAATVNNTNRLPVDNLIPRGASTVTVSSAPGGPINVSLDHSPKSALDLSLTLDGSPITGPELASLIGQTITFTQMAPNTDAFTLTLRDTTQAPLSVTSTTIANSAFTQNPLPATFTAETNNLLVPGISTGISAIGQDLNNFAILPTGGEVYNADFSSLATALNASITGITGNLLEGFRLPPLNGYNTTTDNIRIYNNNISTNPTFITNVATLRFTSDFHLTYKVNFTTNTGPPAPPAFAATDPLVTTPTGGTILPAPATITATANTLRVPDGTDIEFTLNGGAQQVVLSGSSQSNTAQVSFSNVPAGAYTVTAVIPGTSPLVTLTTANSITVTPATSRTVTINTPALSGGQTLPSGGSLNLTALVAFAGALQSDRVIITQITPSGSTTGNPVPITMNAAGSFFTVTITASAIGDYSYTVEVVDPQNGNASLATAASAVTTLIAAPAQLSLTGITALATVPANPGTIEVTANLAGVTTNQNVEFTLNGGTGTPPTQTIPVTAGATSATATFTNLTAGTYTVTVDLFGATPNTLTSANVTIVEPRFSTSNPIRVFPGPGNLLPTPGTISVVVSVTPGGADITGEILLLNPDDSAFSSITNNTGNTSQLQKEPFTIAPGQTQATVDFPTLAVGNYSVQATIGNTPDLVAGTLTQATIPPIEIINVVSATGTVTATITPFNIGFEGKNPGDPGAQNENLQATPVSGTNFELNVSTTADTHVDLVTSVATGGVITQIERTTLAISAATGLNIAEPAIPFSTIFINPRTGIPFNPGTYTVTIEVQDSADNSTIHQSATSSNTVEVTALSARNAAPTVTLTPDLTAAGGGVLNVAGGSLTLEATVTFNNVLPTDVVNFRGIRNATFGPTGTVYQNFDRPLINYNPTTQTADFEVTFPVNSAGEYSYEVDLRESATAPINLATATSGPVTVTADVAFQVTDPLTLNPSANSITENTIRLTATVNIAPQAQDEDLRFEVVDGSGNPIIGLVGAVVPITAGNTRIIADLDLNGLTASQSIFVKASFVSNNTVNTTQGPVAVLVRPAPASIPTAPPLAPIAGGTLVLPPGGTQALTARPTFSNVLRIDQVEVDILFDPLGGTQASILPNSFQIVPMQITTGSNGEIVIDHLAAATGSYAYHVILKDASGTTLKEDFSPFVTLTAPIAGAATFSPVASNTDLRIRPVEVTFIQGQNTGIEVTNPNRVTGSYAKLIRIKDPNTTPTETTLRNTTRRIPAAQSIRIFRNLTDSIVEPGIYQYRLEIRDANNAIISTALSGDIDVSGVAAIGVNSASVVSLNPTQVSYGSVTSPIPQGLTSQAGTENFFPVSPTRPPNTQQIEVSFTLQPGAQALNSQDELIIRASNGTVLLTERLNTLNLTLNVANILTRTLAIPLGVDEITIATEGPSGVSSQNLPLTSAIAGNLRTDNPQPSYRDLRVLHYFEEMGVLGNNVRHNMLQLIIAAGNPFAFLESLVEEYLVTR
jgi:hypothetical protein